MPFPNFLTKLMEFPVVNSAVDTSSGVYNHVKSSNSFMNSTLCTAEAALCIAANMATPIVLQFKDPIESVDRKLAWSLEVLEEKVPIVKEPPAQIFVKTKEAVAPRIENIASVAASGASSLKDKANCALRTPAGNIAMNTLDATSNMTDKAIDYCFPPREGEEELHPHSNSYCEDKVYHVVHTVGTLGIKAGRKVCSAVSQSCQHSNTQPTTASYQTTDTNKTK